MIAGRQQPCKNENGYGRRKPFKPREFKVTKAAALDYEVGDTVRHIKFGVGIVKDIVDGGRDYEVTVDFDKVGVKENVCRICES